MKRKDSQTTFYSVKNKFNLENLGKLYSHFFESWIVNQNKNIKQKIIVNYEDLLDKEKGEVFMIQYLKNLILILTS